MILFIAYVFGIITAYYLITMIEFALMVRTHNKIRKEVGLPVRSLQKYNNTGILVRDRLTGYSKGRVMERNKW